MTRKDQDRRVSEARLAANRANAQKSTGPKSAEGKARASLNALKHGFTSVAKLLPGESQDQFDKVLNGYLDRLCPKDDFERSAIEHIVTIDWQMRRIRTAECCLIDMESTHPSALGKSDPVGLG